jgi:hypothetical protein
MTVSERVYRALLVAYPVDHRRSYGDPMIQLFRDRMRRDGGGRRSILVWVVVSFDLLSSAFRERMETIMDTKNWTSRWWEASVVVLGVNSLAFGIGATAGGYLDAALIIGWAPGVLLLTGFGLRNRQRLLATIMITLGAVAASFAYWVIYPIVLALIVVVGGFVSRKIGPTRAHTATVV